MQSLPQETNMEQISVQDIENEIKVAARLMQKDIVVYSFYVTNYRSLLRPLHYPVSGNSTFESILLFGHFTGKPLQCHDIYLILFYS